MVSWVQGNIEIVDTLIFYNITPNRVKKGSCMHSIGYGVDLLSKIAQFN